MTQKELLVTLLDHGIIHRVGDVWFITDTYKELIEKSEEVEQNVLEIADLSFDYASNYPDEVRLVKPDLRVTAILDYCEVPVMKNTNGKEYMVRSNDKATRTAIDKVISNKNIDATVLLESIRDYYSNSDFPKSFKNYVKDGDLMTMYKYKEDGNTIGKSEEDDTTWL